MDSTGLSRKFKSKSTTEPKGYPGMWQFPKDPTSVASTESLKDFVECVRVESLQGPAQREFKHFEHMFNADKLHSGGVKFEALEEEFLEVRFENGCLKMPRLLIHDTSEMTLRNIMALEQCHYPYTAHVCSYVTSWITSSTPIKMSSCLSRKG
ncbi:unnamed protein product [Microthlaspi erraticum]|uniref:Uncharacterized protein n=1 Tax=Microthlaspi erraticum TaxID=1685480 RepID=A0A6D2J1E7_9BRAS|nr:unnamed protein product [Microthlaspi erraticum]